MSSTALVSRFEKSAAQSGSAPWLLAYQQRLFCGVPLAGRRVLDVGGGNGLMSFFAAANGAGPVVCLDPMADGSNPAMDRQYRLLDDAMGADVDVRVRRCGVEDLDPDSGQFDVVLVHNAVNHFNEAACAALPAAWAAAWYRELFGRIAALLPPDGDLILADCAARNLWGDLGVRNVFAPTIEWRIHQQPRVWVRLLEAAGFDRPLVSWNPPGRLGTAGRMLLANRVGGYLTNSHFTIRMKRASGGDSPGRHV
jgi:SAM-dependent methyltransferase